MKGGEAKFWQQIRIPIKRMGDVDRLESHSTSIGRPDLNLCLVAGPVWDIELKYSDTMETTLRPAQRMWRHKRRRVGGNVGVLTKWVIHGETRILWNINVPDTNQMSDWENYADIIWEECINWAQFEEILREGK